MTAVAVIGAGPSGLFAVDGLTRKLPGVTVDVIERLPTPFGLVRAGVAPDHLGTKAIQRQFERTLDKDGVRLVGNVAVGRDVTLADLAGLYDAVIVATGAPLDRTLGIPGEDLPGVYGSGAFVGWYNGHPDHADLNPMLDGASAVVIGNGNVALDICRVLAKTTDEMAASDIAAQAAHAIQAMALSDIWLVGRRGPVEAAFTYAELKELGELVRCRPMIDAALVPDKVPEGLLPTTARMKEMNLETLSAFARMDEAKPVTLHMEFFANPIAILGDDRVEAVRFERTRLDGGRAVGIGETFDVPASLVVTAIGYRCPAMDGVVVDKGIVVNTDGKVADGLYVVGWAKRGPSGTIPTNRADSLAVIEAVVQDLGEGEGGKEGPAGLDALLAARGARPTTLADWRTIDAAEQARAAQPRPREKFTSVDEMLALLD